MRVHGSLEFYWLDDGVLYNASGSPDNVPSMCELIEVDALFTLPDSFLNKLSGDDLNELCTLVSDVPVWCEATGYLTWGSLSLPMCKSEASDLIECIKCNRSTQCEDPVPTAEIQSFYESDFALVYSRFGLHIKAAFDKYDCNKLYLLVYIEGLSTLQNHTIHTDADNFELVDDFASFKNKLEGKTVADKSSVDIVNYEDYSYIYLMDHFNALDFESKIDSPFIESLREDNWDLEIGYLVTANEVKEIERANRGAPARATCNMNTGLIYCPKKETYFNFYIVRDSHDKFLVNMERRDSL